MVVGLKYKMSLGIRPQAETTGRAAGRPTSLLHPGKPCSPRLALPGESGWSQLSSSSPGVAGGMYLQDSLPWVEIKYLPLLTHYLLINRLP